MLILILSSQVKGFPGGLNGKESARNAVDLASIPSQEDPLEKKENDNPLQYSCWEIPWTEEPGRLQSMGSQKGRTRLSDEHTPR